MAWYRKEKLTGVMALCPETTPFTRARLTLEGGSARMRSDGKEPSSVVGEPLFAGALYTFDDPAEIPWIKLTPMDETEEVWMNVHLKP